MARPPTATAGWTLPGCSRSRRRGGRWQSRVSGLRRQQHVAACCCRSYLKILCPGLWLARSYMEYGGSSARSLSATHPPACLAALPALPAPCSGGLPRSVLPCLHAHGPPGQSAGPAVRPGAVHAVHAALLLTQTGGAAAQAVQTLPTLSCLSQPSHSPLPPCLSAPTLLDLPPCVWCMQNGLGTANTAIACHAGRLLALHEGDLPYSLALACNGLVSTLGRATFE